MSFERAFKKHPFVYLLNGNYYAFGQKTCGLLSSGYITLPGHYEKYINALDSNISDADAWRIYHKLSFIASVEENPAISEMFEFEKLGLNSKEIQELDIQIDKLETFFRKHSLGEYYK